MTASIALPLALAAVLAVAALVYLGGAPKRRARRRAALGNAPFPEEWRAILERNVHYYKRLPNDLKQRLESRIQVFLHEKRFEGCGGMEITEEIRVTIAAGACLLILAREDHYYPTLFSILVYPDTFWTPWQAEGGEDDWGVVDETPEEHMGESWDTGAVVLAWNQVLRETRHPHTRQNVVFHEFAHQLDQELGVAEGLPVLRDPAGYSQWEKVFGTEYGRLVQAVDAGAETFLDGYGAEDPAEFFAVATEAFFERGARMRKRHPALYEQLQRFYALDPAAW